MFKRLLNILLILVLVGNTQIMAALVPNPPKSVVTHGDYFPLPREIYVKFDKLPDEAKVEFESILVSYGVNVRKSFFKQFFTPKIVFKQSKNIANSQGENSVRLTVSYKKVTIEYTNQTAALRGMELFVEFIKKRNGIYVVDGVDVLDWSSGKAKIKSLHKMDGFELTNPEVNKSFIINNINRAARGKSFVLYANDQQRWSIECQTLATCCDQWKTILSIPNYKISDLNDIIQAGKAKGIEVILSVNVMEESEPFTKTTGHSIYSVEGMRFVRAIINEYKTKLGISKIYVGYIPAGINEFYLQFITRVSELLEIEIIYE